jgi:hypothetical protein
MADILTVLITALIGATSSRVIASTEQIISRRRRRGEAEPKGPALGGGTSFGPFTWAWNTALLVGFVALVVVLLSDAPSARDVVMNTFDQFFSTSAQITAALIIALAIEASPRAEETATRFKVEACTCVALGALAALCGLVPGLPRAVYAAALTIVPPGVIGGLVGIVAIAVSRQRESGGTSLLSTPGSGEHVFDQDVD